MKVSVIMGTYNGSATVQRAIASIQNQTFTDWELIVCDDCSTDGTKQILLELADRDVRIKVLENEHNLGLQRTLNRCLAIAKGDYIARMDDDDYSISSRFEKQVKILDNHPNFALVGSNANLVNHQEKWGKRVCPLYPTARQVAMGKNFVHPTVMMRKDILIEVGGYTVAPYTKRCEDYDLWCKLYAFGYQGMNIQEPLLDYYEGKDNVVNRNKEQYQNAAKVLNLWLPYLGKIPLLKKWLIQTKGLVPTKLIQVIRYQKFAKLFGGESA